VHLNRYENVEAILDFGRCLALEPNNVNSLSSRGFAQSRLGNDAEALADFKQVARLAPDEHLGYLGCAFVFSSSTDPGFRDAKGAVDNATKACEMTHWQNPFCLTVLACSLAESGDFEGAVRREEESFALRNDVTEADRKAHQYLLMLFRNGFTYHKRSHTSN
jgi:tetratricopeptide (TPR) repeat protein